MKGICFIEPLFHTTVEGSKTMTRRIINPQPVVFTVDGDNHTPTYKKTRYKAGETVYLKEPYRVKSDDAIEYKHTKCLYHIDNGKWKNKLSMPEKYARYFIKITNVNCERLQDISDEDCIKKGIKIVPDSIDKWGFPMYLNPKAHRDNLHEMFKTPREAYAALIDAISGKGTWKSNPHVWVYEYKLIK